MMKKTLDKTSRFALLLGVALIANGLTGCTSDDSSIGINPFSSIGAIKNASDSRYNSSGDFGSEKELTQFQQKTNGSQYLKYSDKNLAQNFAARPVETPDEILRKADRSFESGKLYDAEKSYQKYLASADGKVPNQDLARIQYQLSLIARKRYQYDKSEEYLLKANQLVSYQNSEYFFSYAKLLYDTNRFEEAEKCFRQLAETQPNDEESRRYLGLAILEQGGRDDCLPILCEAIGETEANRLLAEKCYKDGDLERGESFENKMRKCAQKERKSPPTLQNKPLEEGIAFASSDFSTANSFVRSVNNETNSDAIQNRSASFADYTPPSFSQSNAETNDSSVLFDQNETNPDEKLAASDDETPEMEASDAKPTLANLLIPALAKTLDVPVESEKSESVSSEKVLIETEVNEPYAAGYLTQNDESATENSANLVSEIEESPLEFPKLDALALNVAPKFPESLADSVPNASPEAPKTLAISPVPSEPATEYLIYSPNELFALNLVSRQEFETLFPKTRLANAVPENLPNGDRSTANVPAEKKQVVLKSAVPETQTSESPLPESSLSDLTNNVLSGTIAFDDPSSSVVSATNANDDASPLSFGRSNPGFNARAFQNYSVPIPDENANDSENFDESDGFATSGSARSDSEAFARTGNRLSSQPTASLESTNENLDVDSEIDFGDDSGFAVSTTRRSVQSTAAATRENGFGRPANFVPTNASSVRSRDAFSPSNSIQTTKKPNDEYEYANSSEASLESWSENGVPSKNRKLTRSSNPGLQNAINQGAEVVELSPKEYKTALSKAAKEAVDRKKEYEKQQQNRPKSIFQQQLSAADSDANVRSESRQSTNDPVVAVKTEPQEKSFLGKLNPFAK